MTERSELLTATDETIDDAVRHADPMVLRGLLYQLTGDESIAATEVATITIRNVELSVVKKPADVALIQSKAAAFLKSYRDQGAGDISYGPPERLHRSLSLAAGTDIPASEFDLWLEQLALDPWVRKLVWPETPSAQDSAEFQSSRDRRRHGRSERRRSNEACRHPILCDRKERGSWRHMV